MVRVANVQGRDAAATARQALELAGVTDAVRGKRVLVKFNLSGGPSRKPGATASREAVRGAAECLKPLCDLTLCDAGRPSREAQLSLFERTWAKALAEELDVPLLNLWDEEAVEVPVPRPLARPSWPIPKVLLEADMVGSLAVMKVSAAAAVTLCMKNLFGVLPIERKHELHPQIHQVVVDLHQVLRPAFGIIDGTIGWEGGESIVAGSPVEAGVMVAGLDVVAVDAIGALNMGVDPQQVLYLQLAQELGLGVADPSQVEVVGAPLGQTARRFAPAAPLAAERTRNPS